MADGYGERGRPLTRSPFLIGLTAAAGALVAIITLIGVKQLSTILVMLFAAFFLAVGLDRPVAALTRRGMRRGVAVLLVVIAGNLLACGFLGLVVPVVAEQASAFFAAVPGYVDKLMNSAYFTGLGDSTDLDDRLTELLTPQHVAGLASGLVNGAASLLGAIFLGGTTLILTLFVLAALDHLKAGAYHFVPASRRDRVSRLGDAALDKIGGYIVGALSIAAFAGSAALLWCLLTGIPYPLLLALVVALLDLIPQVGATLGSTVVVLVALSQSLTLALITIAFFVAYQAVENYIIYPRRMGKAVQISNLAAIVGALVGAALFGVIGVLVAIPVYATIQMIVREVVFPRQDSV
ncbi:putative PurR-regulated permease PerM [Allocatelliglobosispora scoriae]|uniref:Putative PurR-regulated permease PerM n=1 Tax=Allocatelliglobosispora scoriae TaxID=643052 RepID=A0A841C1B8_9ACTN|nr:AI-2E family transporter [Allocatelliglobosispora scoriae]MBB5873129.1 putative PurR-regulated permease PerM [Allocatelliglobosispora scoriae]